MGGTTRKMPIRLLPQILQFYAENISVLVRLATAVRLCVCIALAGCAGMREHTVRSRIHFSACAVDLFGFVYHKKYNMPK